MTSQTICVDYMDYYVYNLWLTSPVSMPLCLCQVPGKPKSKQRAVSAPCAGAEFQPTTSRTATSGQDCAVKASIVTTHVDSLNHQPGTLVKH